MKDKYSTFTPEIEMIFQIIKENGGFDQCVADLYAILGLSFTESDYNRWLIQQNLNRQNSNQQTLTPGDKVIVTDISLKNQPYVFNFRTFYEYLGETADHYILRRGANYEAGIYRKEDYVLEKCPEAIDKNLLKPGDRCVVVYEFEGEVMVIRQTYKFVSETSNAFILERHLDGESAVFSKSENRLEKY